jgi:membrane associated rhomboid family serine protease
MNSILLFTILISSINFLLFFLVPDPIAYTFNIKSFVKEPWRFITFQFFHVNITHLVENIIGLTFIALISMELEISFKNFIIVYFLTVFVVLIPILAFFPSTSVAGNSMGIYGVLALSLIKARKLISQKITIPLTMIFIFFLSISNFISCGVCYEKFFKSELFHFFGFISGLSLNFIPTPKVKYILRIPRK